MLVDVKRIRREGEKLSKADFDASPSVRGHLCSWSYAGGYRGGKQLRVKAMTLTVCGRASGTPLLPTLHSVQYVRFNDGGVIFAGVEEIEVRRRHVEVYAQSWFCKPVGLAPGK
ncbi:hypothetical protein DBB29_25025 [Pandoraea cepalis]|uniref:Uncharacterized protein n=1 Tax=Pandoraea cepalis TaxID=2508294 RepID=A0AAW7MGZ0_9BURK|nr:hypothetical protein [Pandoraea cepalis]MDN4571926.1 hypothetical protein [Pandoraea cepalis]MDN4581380.1 hypothetical protein [Pandoraea cepalis]